jgi:hypothetical protein
VSGLDDQVKNDLQSPLKRRLATLIVAGSLSAFWASLMVLNLQSADLSYLMAYGDDHSFLRVLLRMYDSIWPFDPRNFFNISFQSYGFAYFLSQLIVAAPAFAFEAWDTAALLVRMLPACWATGTVLLAALLTRRLTGTVWPAVLVTVLIAALPGFWVNALWNHPDHMMLFFVVATFYRASSIDGAPLKRDIIHIAVLFALAMSSKFPAILASPAVGLYVVLPLLRSEATHKFRDALKILAGLFAATLGFFILFDPYLLHPLGLWGFWDDLVRNLDSNRTNHGLYTVPTIVEKIGVIERYYLDRWAALALFCSFVLNYPIKRPGQQNIVISFLVVLGIAGGAALAANKTWDMYYLMPVTLLVICPVLVAKPDNRFRYLAMALVFAAALFNAARIPAAVEASPYFSFDSAKIERQADSLGRLVAPLVKDRPLIAISPGTPFSFRLSGVRPSDLQPIDALSIQERAEISSHIVLRKDDVYFDDALFADIVRRQLPHETAMTEVRAFAGDLVAGRNPAFLLCAENVSIYVFCHRGPGHPR